MDNRLKQRLVGAAVLASMVVIVVPMVLQEVPVPEAGITSSNIPPEPQPAFRSRITPLSEVREATTPPPVLREASGGPEALGAALPPPVPEPLGTEEPAPPAAPPPSSAKGHAGPPAAAREAHPQRPGTRPGLSAWAVQLGSFSKAENARKLLERLRKKGFTAFDETVSLDRGRHNTRVYVGPEVDRQTSAKTLKRLKKALHLEGMVVRYPNG